MTSKYLFHKQPLLSKIDVFGVGFNFTINGRERYQTVIGAFLTIVYIVIFIALFFGFGVDLYQRKKPKVSFNQETGAYKPIGLSNRNFTYAYRIEDTNAIQVIDESLIYQELILFQYEMKRGTWGLKDYKFLPNKKCQDFPNFKERESYFNISLANWYCLDADDVTLGGNWDGNFVYGLLINTKQCTQGPSRNCSSQDTMKTAFINNITSSNFFYSDLSMKVNPSMDDFEQPLKTRLENHYDMLHLGLTKRKVTTFKTTSIVNDFGWFFSDIQESSVFTVDSILPDFSLKDFWTQDILFSQYLYFGKNYEVYNRSYTKLQEVFATIGGFSKSFYFLMFLIYKFTYGTYKNLLMISHVPITDNELGYSPLKKVRDYILRKENGYYEKNEKNEKNFEKNVDKFEKNDYDQQMMTPTEISLRNLQNCKTGNNYNSPNKSQFNQLNNILPSCAIKNEKDLLKNPNANFKGKFHKRNKPEKLPLPNITFYDYILKKFCKLNSNSGKVRTALNKYSVYESYFANCFDVFSYVNMYREFNEIKNILIEDLEKIDSPNEKGVKGVSSSSPKNAENNMNKFNDNLNSNNNSNNPFKFERKLSFVNSPNRRKSLTVDLERRRSILSYASVKKF
jgi:hypothetical protein